MNSHQAVARGELFRIICQLACARGKIDANEKQLLKDLQQLL